MPVQQFHRAGDGGARTCRFRRLNAPAQCGISGRRRRLPPQRALRRCKLLVLSNNWGEAPLCLILLAGQPPPPPTPPPLSLCQLPGSSPPQVSSVHIGCTAAIAATRPFSPPLPSSPLRLHPSLPPASPKQQPLWLHGPAPPPCLYACCCMMACNPPSLHTVVRTPIGDLGAGGIYTCAECRGTRVQGVLASLHRRGVHNDQSNAAPSRVHSPRRSDSTACEVQTHIRAALPRLFVAAAISIRPQVRKVRDGAPDALLQRRRGLVAEQAARLGAAERALARHDAHPVCVACDKRDL